MRSKRISTDEQELLIMECRQSALFDYQWCQMNEILIQAPFITGSVDFVSGE